MTSTDHWVREYYAAVDSLDVDAAMARIAPDCSNTFANMPPVTGRDAVRATMEGMSSMLRGLHHELRNVFDPLPGTTIVEVDVTYQRLDGTDVTVPATTFIEHDGSGDQITDLRVYLDPSPLFAS